MFEELLPLLHSGNLVVLTGAGVSAESGIKTFRDSNGLWENHDVRKVASPEGFQEDPLLVNRFYNLRRAQLKEVKPNLGHVALTELEKMLGDRFFLVTQNVDNLHERAGSKRILHMHGELLKIRCTTSEDHIREYEGDMTPEMRCSFSKSDGSPCSAPLRPHIVWFGEMPFGMGTIKRKV
ncbi:MAG: Sir2 family NAD-dependent protein deacetylase, partial [Planctomycetota bacterium]